MSLQPKHHLEQIFNQANALPQDAHSTLIRLKILQLDRASAFILPNLLAYEPIYVARKS